MNRRWDDKYEHGRWKGTYIYPKLVSNVVSIPDWAFFQMVAEIEELRASLLAHKENEGDECPLCRAEDDIHEIAVSIEQLLRLEPLIRGQDEVIDATLSEMREWYERVSK